jgi:CheY-like chemotaxis protein
MAHRLNGETATLLVVDDDEAVRKLELRILSQLGHKLLEAEGPVEAMRLAAATPTIHLLLTDFSMPGADGFELAEQFRTVHPQTPVLNHMVKDIGRFNICKYLELQEAIL